MAANLIGRFRRARLGAALMTLAVLTAGVPALVAGPPALAQEMASGRWTAYNQDVTGTWRVERSGGAAVVVLSNDFQTRKGPDLTLYLSELPAGQLSNDDIGKAFVVGALKSPVGGQRFDIAAGTDLSGYNSILIYSPTFEVLWATASLK